MVELLAHSSVEQAILMSRKQEALLEVVGKGKSRKPITGTKLVKNFQINLKES